MVEDKSSQWFECDRIRYWVHWMGNSAFQNLDNWEEVDTHYTDW